MKKIITIIAAIALVVGVLWAQQDRMFIHSGSQVYELARADMDSIVPVLGATAALDVLNIYKNGEIYRTFFVEDVDSIIFNEASPTIFTIDLSEITWEDSYIYNVMVGDRVIGQLAYEFLHKHLPEALEPVVRRRAVVAYPMLNGTINLQNGLVIDNGNFVSWNLRATLPHEMLTYVEGEDVAAEPTIIYLLSGILPTMTTVDNPALARVNTTVTPYVVRDQRTGPVNNHGQTSEDFTYGMVKIGTQFWMRDNLRTTRWIDGTPIPTNFAIAAETDWTDALEPAVLVAIRGHSGAADANIQFADANDPSNSAISVRNRYGVLYNWFAMTRVPHAFLNQPIADSLIVDNISPQGWGVPVRAEFTDLVRYVYNIPTVAASGTITPAAFEGLGAIGGRLSGYTVEAYPGTEWPNTVAANPAHASNLSGFTAVGNVSRSNSALGFNGGTMFLMMDGYGFRPPPGQTGRVGQHTMNFFQVSTQVNASHSPAFPAVQTAHRAKYVRLIRDNICAHIFEFAKIVPPTCTEQGFSLYSCIRCNVDENRAPFVAATGHNFVLDETIAPTCTEEGYDLYECSICGETEKRNVTQPLGHDYTGPAATCTEPQLCVRCGIVLAEPLGHDFGPIQVDVDPTCVATGLGYKECTRCSEKDENIVLSALTPQNVRSEGAFLLWDEVDLAIGYTVEIDGTDYTTETNSFDLHSILAGGDFSFDVRIKPIGNEPFFTGNTCWSDVYSYTAPTTVFSVNIENLEWAYSYVYEIVVNGDVIGHLAYEFLNRHVPGDPFPLQRRAVVAYTVLDNGRANLTTGLVLDNGNFVSWNTNATGSTRPYEILISYVAGEDLQAEPTELFLVEGSPRMTTMEIGTTHTVATLRPMMLRDERTGAEINGETTEVNYYGVVKVGIQYWTRENLRTTRFANGDPIPTAVGEAAGWAAAANGPLAAVSWRNVPGIDGSGNWIEFDANATDPLTVARRARYGVIYNFHAITRTTATMGTELTGFTDEISPDGWSVPMMDNVVMLINYVYNVFGSGDNLPATTGDRDYIPGTIAVPEAERGRLSGYTWGSYPGGAREWRASNLSGFTWLGAHSPSNTGGNNGTSRIHIMDGYVFVPGQADLWNQNVNILPSLRTDQNTHWHNPTWRRVNTFWGDRVRLLKD